jgi:hypothetical protein
VEIRVAAVTDAEYAAIPAVNYSSLKHIAVSPENYRWHLEHPAEQTDSFAFGGAVHCAVLEPDKFDARYQIYDERRDPRTKAWQEWQAAHPGVQTLKSHEMERVKRCSDKVLGDPEASNLLRGGRREEVLTWTDEQTGVPCKGRLDYIRPDLVLDLKTTSDVPKFETFQRAIFKYGYQVQLSLYHDGAVAARRIGGRRNPWIIAVQTKGPFHVACFELDDEVLQHGRKAYRALLQQLVACQAADHWPGITPNPRLMTLPPWAETNGITIQDVDF